MTYWLGFYMAQIVRWWVEGYDRLISCMGWEFMFDLSTWCM
jgi:hypothetical protein